MAGLLWVGPIPRLMMISIWVVPARMVPSWVVTIVTVAIMLVSWWGIVSPVMFVSTMVGWVVTLTLLLAVIGTARSCHPLVAMMRCLVVLVSTALLMIVMVMSTLTTAFIMLLPANIAIATTSTVVVIPTTCLAVALLICCTGVGATVSVMAVIVVSEARRAIRLCSVRFLILVNCFRGGYLTALSMLNCDLPVVERRRLIHLIYGCIGLLTTGEEDISEAARLLRVVILDYVHINDCTERRESLPQMVLCRLARDTGDVDVAVVFSVDFNAVAVFDDLSATRISVLPLDRSLLDLVLLELNIYVLARVVTIMSLLNLFFSLWAHILSVLGQRCYFILLG